MVTTAHPRQHESDAQQGDSDGDQGRGRVSTGRRQRDASRFVEFADAPDVVDVSATSSSTVVMSSGVTRAESSDSKLVPMALVAVTVNV